MKNNMIKYLACAAMTLGLAANVQAALITGDLTMGGGARFDTTSVNTAHEVTAWVGPNKVTSVTCFAGVSVGDLVALTAPWIFVPTTPKTALWSVDGYTFNLASSAVFQGGGYLNVTGTGTISHSGDTTTDFIWRFSSQDPGAGRPVTWSWSASTSQIAVPDGGMTVMLLGAALSGLALIRRKLA
jgi:hypothetical protein